MNKVKTQHYRKYNVVLPLSIDIGYNKPAAQTAGNATPPKGKNLPIQKFCKS